MASRVLELVGVDPVTQVVGQLEILRPDAPTPGPVPPVAAKAGLLRPLAIQPELLFSSLLGCRQAVLDQYAK